MLIRRLEPKDIDGLLALFDAVAAEKWFIDTEPGYDRESYRRGFTSRLGDDAHPVFVAIDNGTVVGFSGIHTHPAYGPTLGMMVASSHRRLGIGRQVMEALDGWARAFNVPALNLFVFPHNEGAVTLYQSLGYVEIERFEREIERADGEMWDTILMRKTIA